MAQLSATITTTGNFRTCILRLNTKRTNYNWYQRHLHVTQFFGLSSSSSSSSYYYYYYYYYYYLLLESFSYQFELMVSHWSLSDSKSPQVFRTLLSILAVLSNAVIWIVSTRPPTSYASRPFNNPLIIVPKAPITIGTIVTFMFHSFFNSLSRSRYLYFFSHSFSFIL